MWNNQEQEPWDALATSEAATTEEEDDDTDQFLRAHGYVPIPLDEPSLGSSLFPSLFPEEIPETESDSFETTNEGEEDDLLFSNNDDTYKDETSFQFNTEGHRARMRKKFFDRGWRVFSEVELLEMVLMLVIPRKDVKPLAKKLISHYKSLAALIHADPKELRRIKGVGETVIWQLKMMEASCSAILRPTIRKGTILKEWRQILDFCKFCISHERYECLFLIFLNRRMQLISIDNIQKGTSSRIPVIPMDILKRALNLDAISVLIIHNHPSGISSPSDEDLARTQEIVDILKPSGITVYDHLIIAKHSVYSFNKRGLVR